MTNEERLTRAMKHAVAGGMLPGQADGETYLRNWRVMGEILDAACGDNVELAQELRHNTERLAGLFLCVRTEHSSRDADEAFENLHDIAERISPGSEADLLAYVIEPDTALELLREIRDGLAPSLAGMSEDAPVEALLWAWSELHDYQIRIERLLMEVDADDEDAAD